MGRGSWQAAVHGVAESDTTEHMALVGREALNGEGSLIQGEMGGANALPFVSVLNLQGAHLH